jgi:hypothetical protein
MPLIKAYNIDSDLYGLKSHSIFKSVYTVEASWKGTFGHLMQTASAENRFSLEDLRRRSIDPTLLNLAGKHLQNKLQRLISTVQVKASSTKGRDLALPEPGLGREQ